MALAAFAAMVARTNFLIDDAYIAFRYARNWSETGVPAYHPAGAPHSGHVPVEGYSDFLWVLLLRWCHDLGFDLEVASRVMSIACGALLVGLFHRTLRRQLGLGPAAAAFGSVGLATFPPFATWSTGGLEGALQALCTFGAFALLVRRGGGSGQLGAELTTGLAAGLTGAALALVRVEGFGWVLAVALCAALARRADGRPSAARCAGFLVTAGVAFGVFLLWRHAVYGQWLANTAQAKSGLSGAVLLRGAKTVATFLLLFVSPLVALAAVPFAARGRRRGVVLGAAAMVAVFLAYNVLVGGDWMPMFRFLAPASPFVFLLLASAFERAVRGRASVPAASALAAGCIALQVLPVFGRSLAPRAVLEPLYFREFQIGYQTEWQRWQRGEGNRDHYRRIGRALRQIVTPEDSLTLGPIGAIGYFSGVRVHDRNGLVDPEVARRNVDSGSGTAGHDKRVPRSWFLPREPTLFQALVWPSPRTGPVFPGFDAAARFIGEWVFQDPAEAPILPRCVPEAYHLRPDEGLPQGSVLVVLRATDDEAAARALWQRVGLGPVLRYLERR